MAPGLLRRARRGRGEGGFSLIEVLIALMITVIGLAGVMIMQAHTVRENRDTAEFNYAASLANEVMESTRSVPIDLLLDGATAPSGSDPGPRPGVTYDWAAVATPVPSQANLVLVRVTVTYYEDGVSATSADARHATVELVRTRTESL